MNRLLIFAAVLLTGLSDARAHDIPNDVRLQAFAKPERQSLKLLLRVPLKAMRDVDVPQRSGGFLDFSRVDTSLRNAVSLWLSDEIEMYEDDIRLARPRVIDARVSLASAMRWLMALLIIAGLAWVVSEAVKRHRKRS